ncbi:DUF1990 family protein [Microbacterium sp. M3]|uniref:DUF1990 family protein n=1 Tax=Microbacterium arthrosphaerae TaxID=792652 RepID=A0ABU4GY96_9MICO|nr:MULTISPECIES: DUF1990 family protein [Microbacterium]MDW4571424.1 DUF1990 family protein [Microbacterium arthrosphaerae]MDW7605279.1 DUF1990 family protein [Microbacterium sp. M3]
MSEPDPVSLTQPESPRWTLRPEGFRRWERSTALGRGDGVWRWASDEVLRWGVKTRSGFGVSPDGPVSRGDRPVIMAHPFGLSVREPVEVVAVVERPDRVGFAYRTLAGHPVSGEEAFIVHRDGEAVMLTVRSLTRPGDDPRWRAAYPALLVAQSVARRRYLRALRVRAAR